MLRYLVYFIIFAHGLIHLFGFLKAWHIVELDELTLPISKMMGLIWLGAALFVLAGGITYYLKQPMWMPLILTGAIISQLLIFNYWADAKYGTIANILLLLVLLAGFSAQRFEREFQTDIATAISSLTPLPNAASILTEKDISHLPDLVQNYLRYTGSVGLPKVVNFKTEMHGEMRQEKTDNWFIFTSNQYNAVPAPTRLFFMKAMFKGLPTAGYHAYQDQEAFMLIKVLSLLPVVDLQEANLFQAETVTYFNDLCIMAPAALIDDRIRWENTEGQKVSCTFTNQGVQISATLLFAEDGRLINFFSEDRIDINSHQKFLFSTPLSEYRVINGRRLAGYGEAIWHYPEGEFVYGRFNIDNIIYNATQKPMS